MGLAYFAITVSGAFYVTISILETIASIRQSQLSNLQKMQNALQSILVKGSAFLAFLLRNSILVHGVTFEHVLL